MRAPCLPALLQVVHELLPLELLLLLLETPSDDGVEVAVDFLKEVGGGRYMRYMGRYIWYMGRDSAGGRG